MQEVEKEIRNGIAPSWRDKESRGSHNVLPPLFPILFDFFPPSFFKSFALSSLSQATFPCCGFFYHPIAAVEATVVSWLHPDRKQEIRSIQSKSTVFSAFWEFALFKFVISILPICPWMGVMEVAISGLQMTCKQSSTYVQQLRTELPLLSKTVVKGIAFDGVNFFWAAAIKQSTPVVKGSATVLS